LTYSFAAGQLVNNDLLSGGLATSANASSPVGNYTIGQGSLAATSNYDLTFVAGALTIQASVSQPPVVNNVPVVNNAPVASQAIQSMIAPVAVVAKLPEIKIVNSVLHIFKQQCGRFR